MSSSITPNKNSNTAETSPNVVRVIISTPQIAKTPTSDEIVAAGRRLSLSDESSGTTAVAIEKISTKALATDSGSEDPSEDIQCELDSLREQLQQALDDKAELIEESILDKERIKDQKETIELLTKRIREFEMGRSNLVLPVPSRSRSNNNSSQIKQLSEDNIQLAREVDRLITERDRLEKKLIDLKIKFANGYLSRQNSGASTDEDEIDNETNIFSTLSVDERLRRKKGKKVLGLSTSNKPSVFSAAKSWFSRKNRSGASSPNKSRIFSKSNEMTTETQGIAV
jgi:hypothetical protein